ncbi:hypothetical protein ACNF49_24050 [Actinomadura sp. ATCC 39365]
MSDPHASVRAGRHAFAKTPAIRTLDDVRRHGARVLEREARRAIVGGAAFGQELGPRVRVLPSGYDTDVDGNPGCVIRRALPDQHLVNHGFAA